VNVKAGDLAIIRGIEMLPELNGRIVEVLSIAVEGEEFLSVDGVVRCLITTYCGAVWRVRGREALPWKGSLSTKFFAEIPMRDDKLIPLGGIPVTDDIDTEIPA
jgi:hypothetical protein